jgi:hypothetical protein
MVIDGISLRISASGAFSRLPAVSTGKKTGKTKSQQAAKKKYRNTINKKTDNPQGSLQKAILIDGS